MSKSKEARTAAQQAAKKAAQAADQVASEMKRLEDARAALEDAHRAMCGSDVDGSSFEKHVARRGAAQARVDALDARTAEVIRAAADASRAAEEADVAAEEAEIDELKSSLAALNDAILAEVRQARAAVVAKLKVFAKLVDEANRRDRALIVRRGGKDEGWRYPDYYGTLCADLSPEAQDVIGRLESRLIRGAY